MILIVNLATTRRNRRKLRRNVNLLNSDRPPRVRQYTLRSYTTIIRHLRFLQSGYDKRGAIITITMRTPLYKRRPKSRVSTKSSIRSITNTPILFRATTYHVIIIGILLRLKTIYHHRHDQNNGNVSRNIFLFRLQRRNKRAHHRWVHCTTNATMTTRPRLRNARQLTLNQYLGVSTCFFDRLPHHYCGAHINTTKTYVGITKPLNSVAKTTRRHPSSNRLSTTTRRYFTNGNANHHVQNVIRTINVIRRLRLNGTRLYGNVPSVINATSLTHRPVMLITLPQTIHDHDRTRNNRYRLVIMLYNNIIRRTITMVMVIPRIDTTTITTMPRNVMIIQRNTTSRHHDHPNLQRHHAKDRYPHHGNRHGTLAGIPSFRTSSPLPLQPIRHERFL